jgi:hypothetical protein
MFSGDPLVVKIPYHNLPSIIYVTCEFDTKEFCSHYRLYKEKGGYNDLLLKIDRIAECKVIIVLITSLLPFKNNDVY